MVCNIPSVCGCGLLDFGSQNTHWGAVRWSISPQITRAGLLLADMHLDSDFQHYSFQETEYLVAVVSACHFGVV